MKDTAAAVRIKKPTDRGVTRDLLIALVLGIVVFLLFFYALEFSTYGISTPVVYSGHDDFQWLFYAKNIAENGWFTATDRLGAPFTAEFNDYSGYYLWNADCLITLLISLFTKDAAVITNIQLLISFSLCAVSAFLVMRELNYSRALAALGGVLFCLSPYIIGRIVFVPHYNLAYCYFVPLSVLLCIRSGEDGPVSGRKKVSAVLFCALIANNGWGYYPIFTCFFLCVTALYRLLSTRQLKSVFRPLLYVVLIAVFFLLALIPVFSYWHRNGAGIGITIRDAYQAEIFGLKIARFFVPLNGHGISLLEKCIAKYNGAIPILNNENITAYLGPAGIIGFLVSLACVFSKRPEEQKERINIHYFGVLIICGILLAAIGGFSDFVSIVFPLLRSYNRISIFITFICVLVFCSVLGKWYSAWLREKKIAGVALLSLLTLVCILDVLPIFEWMQGSMEVNRSEFQSDRAFVQQIESSLDEGAMISQFPFHSFPEAGMVNNMPDYAQFIGYIHSRSLKWSYGGVKGRESDEWNKRVAALPMRERIDELCAAGFSGLYVDTRAYTEEELARLRDEIESVLGRSPMVSNHGKLLFYTLFQ